MARLMVGTVAAFALVVALGANAQTQAWDQAKVTAAAAEFESAVSGLREAVKQSSQWTISVNKAPLYQVLQDLRQIEWLSQSLHADLVKGEGLEATTPQYLQMVETRSYAKADAMFVDIGASIKPKLDASRAAFTKLTAFYPATPPKGSY
jgi:hypothetical protein